MLVRRIRALQLIKRHKEERARSQQRLQELKQELRRLKSAKEKEEKINFFPTWKPAQGVTDNTEDEEQYMTIGEDGRPYIAVTSIFCWQTFSFLDSFFFGYYPNIVSSWYPLLFSPILPNDFFECTSNLFTRSQILLITVH